MHANRTKNIHQYILKHSLMFNKRNKIENRNIQTNIFVFFLKIIIRMARMKN